MDSKHKIPAGEEDNILSVYWQMLKEIEAHTKPDRDPLNALLVRGAYKVLNRIGYTKAVPRFDEIVRKKEKANG